MSGELIVKDLGKSYRQWGGELRRIASWFIPFIVPREEHWVLKDINFSISPGEAVGIIGINGAGKSTLLKMITGTTQPTTGSVRITGRVAALLELGMGFSPDLTGRQNAYHSAGLMGYSRAEIDRAMPGIEEFSEVGEYFDKPMRIYSSGMQMRVAFSLATAQRPDVLIIDEALSVGDAYFQHKSFDRIREFRRQGTTLLIVSHDKQAIQSICDRAILLSKGCLAKEGSPEEVMDYYNALIAERENSTVTQIKLENGMTQTISGTNEAQVEEVGLYNVKGEQIVLVGVSELVELRIQVRINKAIPQLVLGYMIKDRLGQPIFGTNTWHTGQIVEDCKANEFLNYSVRLPMDLGPGSYSITIALTETQSHVARNFEWRELAVVFSVLNVEKYEFAGCAWLDQDIRIEHVSAE